MVLSLDHKALIILTVRTLLAPQLKQGWWFGQALYRFFRAVTKSQGPGILPGYYERDYSRLLLQETKGK